MHISLGIFGSSLTPVGSTGAYATFSYTGTGSAQSFTNPGFQPDLIFIFSETAAAPSWLSFNSTTGTGAYIIIPTGVATVDAQSITAFGASGFSVGTSAACNTNGRVYQAFCWKKGTNILDLVSFTGNATNRTISHSLGSVPKLMFDADVSGLSNQISLYEGDKTIANPFAGYYAVSSNATLAFTSAPTAWNNTNPTSSVFSLGTSSVTNSNTHAYINILFGIASGVSASGTYTGNGSTTGPTVSGLGFTPSLVMIINSTAPSGNNILMTYGNTASGKLNINSSGKDSTNYIDLVSGGFNVKSANALVNNNAQAYMYFAWGA